jgi:hypothetical protein
MSILPKELNFNTSYNKLPSGTVKTSMCAAPINGAVFGPSQVIQFQLERRGYMVPESMYIRYKNTYFNRDAIVGTSNWIRGTPVYTFIQKLETLIDGNLVELINNYNQVANFLVNCKCNYAQKVALAIPFGYNTGAQTGFNFTFSTAAPNGQSLSTTLNTGSTLSYSAPLGCLLSNASTLVPLKHMKQVMMQLTTESLSNAMSLEVGVGTPHPIASFSMDDIELCYDIIEFSPMVDLAISSRASSMIIKSQSYTNSAVRLLPNSIGTLDFLFNNRLASIKSLFVIISGTDNTTSKNMMFDAMDATVNSGDYQWICNSIAYPSRPLSTIINKSAILLELSSAFGPVHDMLSTNFSINPTEFACLSTTVTTQNQPGKFFLGTNTEQLSTSDSFLTGISSQNSPITFRISLGVSNTGAMLINQICHYDVILSIDAASGITVISQ